MSNTIPPLLCSTPPPIDFDDGGGTTNGSDDFETFESGEDVYGRFEGSSVTCTPEHSISNEKRELELPLPDFIPFPTNPPVVTPKIDITNAESLNPGITKAMNDYFQVADTNLEQANVETIPVDVSAEKKEKSILTKDPIGFMISEPPPFDIGYSSESQSPKNSREDSPLSLEFSPENLSDDDDSIEFQINESRYDDNTSLPSLKFDAINISKSATPILEDKAIVNKISSVEALPLSSENENASTSAFQTNASAEDATESSEDIEGGGMQCVETENVRFDGEPTNFSDGKISNELQDGQATLVGYEEAVDAVGENDTSTSQKQRATSEPAVEHAPFDDFNTDFQAFESCPVFPDDLNTTFEEKKVEYCSEEFAFEADFSRVDFPPVEQSPPNTAPVVNKDDEVSFEIQKCGDDFDDEFEDFQDYKAAEVADKNSIISNHDSITLSNTKIVSNEIVDGDDDFDEFSDFKEATVLSDASSSKNFSVLQLPKLDDRLKGVLDMMFPIEDNSMRISKNDKKTLPGVLASNLILDLREIDSAKALEYQWLQSNVKNSLVKSLGIDSRNILYGEKWNSSMPRYAANLGFGPLEPLKPTKLSSDTSSALQPTQSNTSNSLDIPSTSSSTSEVPAVKFDWNSSGLVNPLDASHAHTLLLDLDQLVVVANLDKIKLDSSSPCSSGSLSRATTTATPTIVAHSSGNNAIATTTFHDIRNLYLTPIVNRQSLDKPENSIAGKYMDVIRLDFEQNVANGFRGGDGDGIAWINNNTIKIKSTMDDVTTRAPTAIATNHINPINATNCVTNTAHVGLVHNSPNDIFDRYLECRVKEIIHEGKTETVHPTQSDNTYGSSDITSLAKISTTAQQTSVDIVASLSNINNDLKGFEKTVDDLTIETSNTTNTSYRNEEIYKKSPTMPPTPKFIPLKETHIFTPSKSEGTIARSVSKSIEKQPIDFDYEIAAAGIVINEQVVNKEYRDIVYNPETENNNRVETFMTGLSEKDRSVKKDSNEPIVDPNKSFRHKSTAGDFLSKPIMNILERKEEAPSEADCPLDDEFSDFQQTSPPSDIFQEPNLKNSDHVAKYKLEPSALSNVSNYNNSPAKNEHLDEEFTDFQSVPPPIKTNSHSKSAFDTQRKNKAETSSLNDEMILSPAILLPQAVKIESSEPKINWPSDSNIDPEELARLEQLFPQAKQVAAQSFVPNSSQNTPNVSLSPKKDRKDDEDWSDFVSVPPPVNSTTQKPKDISMVAPTKLSTISKTYDDEDWSDFVSSAPASGPVAMKPWNMSQLPPPQFSSWNQPTTCPSFQPPLGLLQNAPATSHYPLQQLEITSQRIPIVPGKNLHQFKVDSNRQQFLMNGQMNTLPQSDQKALHRLHYQQQQAYSNQQRLPLPAHQQSQMPPRISPNTNTNFNVLKSQLNSAPSISLIPDLSFTAPKPLVQLSRTNTSNKK